MGTNRSIFHVVLIAILMLASGALCTGNYQNAQQQSGGYLLNPYYPSGSSGPYPLARASPLYYPSPPQVGGQGATAVSNPQTTVQVAQGEAGGLGRDGRYGPIPFGTI